MQRGRQRKRDMNRGGRGDKRHPERKMERTARDIQSRGRRETKSHAERKTVRLRDMEGKAGRD